LLGVSDGHGLTVVVKSIFQGLDDGLMWNGIVVMEMVVVKVHSFS
jgi:hypothetical protein